MNVKKTVWHRSISSVLLTVAAVAVGLLVSVSALAQSQSPIDIRAENLVVDRLPALRFTYENHVTLNVINTGSPEEEATVRAIVPAGAGQLEVAGVTYNLLQFHWHTPAEHLIDGEEFPLEMHLVHQAASGALLVVGILIDEQGRHAELDKIFEHLPEEEGPGTTVSNFNLKRLLPGNLESFRYSGSLTTPPFTEGVQWVVLAKPIRMSRHQIEAFMSLFPEGNTREVQPLNGRQVLTDIRPGHFRF